MPRLREIRAAHNEICWITEAIAESKSLIVIDLYRNKLDAEGVAPIKALADQLEELDLTANSGIGLDDVEEDLGIRNYKDLESRLRIRLEVVSSRLPMMDSVSTTEDEVKPKWAYKGYMVQDSDDEEEVDESNGDDAWEGGSGKEEAEDSEDEFEGVTKFNHESDDGDWGYSPDDNVTNKSSVANTKAFEDDHAFPWETDSAAESRRNRLSRAALNARSSVTSNEDDWNWEDGDGDGANGDINTSRHSLVTTHQRVQYDFDDMSAYCHGRLQFCPSDGHARSLRGHTTRQQRLFMLRARANGRPGKKLPYYVDDPKQAGPHGAVFKPVAFAEGQFDDAEEEN